MAGKGDKYRKVDKKKYDQNYDRIFRSKITAKEEEIEINKNLCPKCGTNLNHRNRDSSPMWHFDECPECLYCDWKLRCFSCGKKEIDHLDGGCKFKLGYGNLFKFV